MPLRRVSVIKLSRFRVAILANLPSVAARAPLVLLRATGVWAGEGAATTARHRPSPLPARPTARRAWWAAVEYSIVLLDAFVYRFGLGHQNGPLQKRRSKPAPEGTGKPQGSTCSIAVRAAVVAPTRRVASERVRCRYAYSQQCRERDPECERLHGSVSFQGAAPCRSSLLRKLTLVRKRYSRNLATTGENNSRSKLDGREIASPGASA
jgi:hypothetical protein